MSGTPSGPLPALWVFQGSHPCEAVIAAAACKGVGVRRIEVPPVLHRAIIRMRGFPTGTAPAMSIGARRVHGTSDIFRALDELAPGEPRLHPGGALGTRIADAEAWGAGDLQDSGRRIVWGHFRRSPDALRAWAALTPNPMLRAFKRTMIRPAAVIASTAHQATPERIVEDLQRVPAVLDRVDALIADGVIGGEQPNAADFQILSTIGVWMVLEDLRAAIEQRPAGQAAARLFPDYVARPGLAAGALPQEWLAPLYAAAPSERQPTPLTPLAPPRRSGGVSQR